MSPFHQPGWRQPNGHVVRSHMEAALCDYLTTAREPHTHASLNFDVPIGPNRTALFVPSLVLTRARAGRQVILIEPIDSVHPGGGVRRLRGFRDQHSATHFLIVVARRALHHHIPRGAYDLLVPLEDFQPLADFLAARA
jgi:hypothetical protein